MAFYKLQQGYTTRWSNDLAALTAKAKRRSDDWIITDSDNLLLDYSRNTPLDEEEMENENDED